MKQYYCFECGIPVKDRLNRTPDKHTSYTSSIQFYCRKCVASDSYALRYVIDNGVFFTSISYSPSKRRAPHYPRWNYP